MEVSERGIAKPAPSQRLCWLPGCPGAIDNVVAPDGESYRRAFLRVDADQPCAWRNARGVTGEQELSCRVGGHLAEVIPCRCQRPLVQHLDQHAVRGVIGGKF